MPKFMIEVTHEKERTACARAVRVFLETGSHWLTNADWGCMDGDHRCWITVDLPTKQEALQILPPAFRAPANIIQLNQFSMAEIDEILKSHKG